jgi:hypothetical protein
MSRQEISHGGQAIGLTRKKNCSALLIVVYLIMFKTV